MRDCVDVFQQGDSVMKLLFSVHQCRRSTAWLAGTASLCCRFYITQCLGEFVLSMEQMAKLRMHLCSYTLREEEENLESWIKGQATASQDDGSRISNKNLDINSALRVCFKVPRNMASSLCSLHSSQSSDINSNTVEIDVS